MSPDDIRGMIREQPFKPFRLHMSNGMAVEVRHPEMIAVSDESVAIEVYNERRQRSHMQLYSVINMNMIEPILSESD